MAHNCNPEDCCGGREDCPDDDILSVLDAAKHVKMHPHTIRRLAEQGKMPGKKIGKDWQFSKSVLDEWLVTALK